MDTTKSGTAQAEAQDVVSSPWRPIADAPQRPGFTCDIWSASEQRRFTDCFWDKDHWAFEDFDSGRYRVRKVPDPLAFIPCPEAPAQEVL